MRDKLCCSVCKSKEYIRSGTQIRRIRSVPIGSKQVILEMKVQRLECRDCHSIRQEDIHFVTGKRTYSNKLARLVVELSRLGSIKDVSNHLHLSWDTVKDIEKRYLYRNYNKPDISHVRHIGIDEFAVAKGHIYKTIVVDLETGRVIYIGQGKGSDALDGFRKKVAKAGIGIEAVATDLSPAFIAAVTTNLPEATLVFDHFHVVKLMNDALDEIRRGIYREEKDLNKRKVIKGTRWLLLCNGKDIFDDKYKSGLDNALLCCNPNFSSIIFHSIFN